MQDVFRMAFDGIYQVDGALNGADALAAASRHPYAVAIVDLRMEGMSGVQLLAALKEMSPCIQVIIFTGHASMESAISAVNSGAFRYLQKPFQLKEIRQCLEDAFARHARESHRPAAFDFSQALAKAGIVGRKAEIALQVMDYKSTKEIANTLKLSPRTVEKHLESVFAILRISSRREMIARLKNLLAIAAPIVLAVVGSGVLATLA